MNCRATRLFIGEKLATNLFLSGFLLAGVLVFAIQGRAEQDDRKSPELQLRLSTTTMMLCLGSSLPLELEISNLGNVTTKIDRADLWSSFSYTFSRTDGSGPGGGMGMSCNHCRGNYIVIKPGGNYKSSYNYLLDDSFFQEPGYYTIKMNYEQLSTNQLTFELYDCNPK